MPSGDWFNIGYDLHLIHLVYSLSKTTIETPLHLTEGMVMSPTLDNLKAASYRTPQSSPKYQSLGDENDSSNARNVQFGPTRVVEYEANDPSLTMTPMPADEAARRYPTEMKAQTEAETSLLLETKENTALLDEWDDQEDYSSEDLGFSLIEQSDDSSDEEHVSSRVVRQPPRSRRSSSYFMPAAGSHRLLEDEQNEKTKDATIGLCPGCSDDAQSSGSPVILDDDRQEQLDGSHESGSKIDSAWRKRSFLSLPTNESARTVDHDSENEDTEKSELSDLSSACTVETLTPSNRGKEQSRINGMGSVDFPRLSLTSPLHSPFADDRSCVNESEDGSAPDDSSRDTATSQQTQPAASQK